MRNFLFFLTLLCSGVLSAQVVINEFSASNLNGFLDNYQKTEDWVELYNMGAQTVNLGGWYLSDKPDDPTKWKIPAGTDIHPGGHLVVWCSGRDEGNLGGLHTNFKLTQTKGNEYLVLSNPQGVVQESHFVDITLVEHSHCRTTDGASEWAICTQPTPEASNNGSPQFSGYTATPSMSVSAGFYDMPQVVEITNNEPNSVLRYTLDGTNPTQNSPIYSMPLAITATTVVKAQSFSNDPEVLPGRMEFNTYFINEDISLAVFSVAADQLKQLANGQGDLIPIGSIEYFENGQRVTTSFGSLNRHGQDSWALPHRSLDWVSRDEMGYSKAVDAQLFKYSDRDEYQRFMFRASGDDNYPAVNDNAHEGSCHIRDEYVQLLSHLGGMKLDLRAVERVVVFLNGEYWGVYGLRERPVDHDYTEYYYDQDKYNIQYLSTWGDTEIEYGGTQAFNDWIAFRDFVLNNDMGDADNYEYVKDNLQLTSLCDYFIANLNTVASDWLNYNTGWWRGLDPDGDHKKWGYILWDNDATFDYYINYSGVPNTDPDAVPCDIDEISDFMDGFFNNGGGGGTPIDPSNCQTVINGTCPYPATDTILGYVMASDDFCCNTDWDNICQDLYDDIASGGGGGGGGANGDVGKHEKIFLKLQEENDDFRQLYYSRQADLMNTVYTCENMISKLDSMVAVIEPEMPRQIQRWGGSMNEWQNNLDDLYDFVEQRCALLDDGMIDCFDLTGPFNLSIMVQPSGSGRIQLNTLTHSQFPWTGAYFGGMKNLLEAKEWNGGLDFHHWESLSGQTAISDPFSKDIAVELMQNDTIIAYFGDFVSNAEVGQADYGLFAAPNPTNGQVTVRYQLPLDVKTHRLQIRDLYGRIIFEENDGATPAVSVVKALDFRILNCSTGIYLVELQTEQGTQVKKVSYQQ